MRILALDTSTMLGSVALSEDLKLIAEEQIGVNATHSERLLTTIEHLLDLADWSMDDLDAVAVAIGPGSFTGLRIGLATAKGIAFGLKKPIVGVSSLLVLAYNGLISNMTVVPIIDARRKEVYAAAYRFKQAKGGQFKLNVILEETVIDPKELCKKLKAINSKLLLVGDGIITYEKELKKQLGSKAHIITDKMVYPHASHLAAMAYERLKKNKSDDIVALAPNYIRRSDAEIGFRGKTKTKHLPQRHQGTKKFKKL